MSKSELRHLLSIRSIPKIGPILLKNLVAYAGSPQKVFELSKKELLKIPKIGIGLAETILAHKNLNFADHQLQLAAKLKVNVVSYLDQEYPARLKAIPDSPPFLYYKGSIQMLNHSRIIALVGTRTPSSRAFERIEKLLSDLTPYQPIIVSGMAFGVDSIVHQLANDLRIPNFGILGSGLNRIYPQYHKKLALKTMNNGGLISEFFLNQKPNRENFPMRNRTIAALSDVVVVIESKKRGGSMITANLANQYNKDVFAIPGRSSDELSKGCNLLIKSHQAHLLDGAADISYILGWQPNGEQSKQLPLVFDLEEHEQGILDIIKENDHISIDQLSIKSSLDLSFIAKATLNLEFKGLIRKLPGKRFTLTRNRF